MSRQRQRIVLPRVEPPAVLDDSWWMPLILFFARLRDEGSCDLWLSDWDWREFMVMNGVERRPRPFIVVYKHTETRRCVNVDRSGWAYSFTASGPGLGRYQRHKRLRDAFWQLDPIFLHEVREHERARAGDPWERDDEPDTSSDWLASPDPPAGPYDTWAPDDDPDAPPTTRRPRKPKLAVVPEQPMDGE